MSENQTQAVTENEIIVNDVEQSPADLLSEEALNDEGHGEDEQAVKSPVEEAVEATAEQLSESAKSAEDDLLAEIMAQNDIIEEIVVPVKKAAEVPDLPEVQRILKLQVPIIVRLAHKVLPVGEITQFSPGVIIEFDKKVDEKLDLLINNKCIGKGQAVKVGEKFGLKVINMGSIEQMIKAMGA
jgi:flagellar motor switch protein FliN